MTQPTQPEALRREYRATMPAEVLHLWALDALACIAELETQIEAIGAGGVEPLRRMPGKKECSACKPAASR